MTNERFITPDQHSNANFVALSAGMDLGLPPELAHNPEIVRAAANAAQLLAAVDQVHGRGGVDFEVSRDTQQLMPYHNGEHSRGVVTDAVTHLAMTGNTNPEDYAIAMIAAACHDAVQSAGPGKNEEISADMAAQEMLRRGYSPVATERARQAVLGTTLVAGQRLRQKAYDSLDPAVVAVAVGDLVKLARYDGPKAAFELFLETHAHLLPQRQQTYQQAVRAINTPEGNAALAQFLANQRGFYEAYQYPKAVNGDVDAYYGRRSFNADLLESLGQRVHSGEMNVLDVWDCVTSLCA